MTLAQHLEESAAAIEQEALEYAKSYGVSLEIARRDVTDAYIEGWHDGTGVEQ